MRLALSILLLFTALQVRALDFVTWTMTITNGSVTNDAYYINGAARIGATNRTSTTWATNANKNWTATNIFSQFGGWPVSGVLITNTATNVLIFKGVELSMSASNFATLTASTQLISALRWNPLYPFSAMASGLRMTNGNETVTGVNSATNEINAYAPAMVRFPSLTNVQTIANKVLTNSLVRNGTNDGTKLTNIPSAYISEIYAVTINADGGTSVLSGVISGGKIQFASVTNAPWVSATNSRIASARIEAAVIDALNTTNATTWGNLYIGDTASGINTAWGLQTSVSGANENFQIYNDSALASGYSVNYDGSRFATYFGNLSTDVATNHGAFYSDYIFTPSLSATNSTSVVAVASSQIVSSNYQSGPWAFKIGTYSSMSTAGGGINFVSLATNRWTLLSGNSGDCYVNTLASDWTEREAGIINASAYNMTLVHQSGSYDTGARRMTLPGGVNLVLQPGAAANFQHDESAATWRLVSTSAAANTNFLSGDSFTFSGNPVTLANGVLTYQTSSAPGLVFRSSFSSVTYNINYETFIFVRNTNSALTLTNGHTITLVGADTNNSDAKLALYANSSVPSRARVNGVLTMDIAPGNYGLATAFGDVHELPPALTNFNNGDRLFQAPLDGVLTNSPPTLNSNVQYFVGVYSKTNATASIFVQPTPAFNPPGLRQFSHFNTNTLFASSSLNFPLTLTLTSSDLGIAVTGCTSNSVIGALGVPWQAAAGGGTFFAYPSNGVVYVRFANNTGGNINPDAATFSVMVFNTQP